MLPRERISLYCPDNDLESHTILDIARRLGLETRVVVGGWGLTLGDGLRQHPDLDSLRDHVILVELPGPAAIKDLKAAGKRVHIVDHHGPGEDGTKPSSLEQFAELVGYNLTPAEYEIAIADRDFFPGLSQAGVKYSRAQELRRQESEIRGDVELLKEAESFVAANKRRLGQFFLYFAPQRLANVLLEAAQTPQEDTYNDAARSKRPVSLPEVLAVFHDDKDTSIIRAVRFSGRANHRRLIEPLLSDPALKNGLNLWLGGGTYSCFFGADARPGYVNPSVTLQTPSPEPSSAGREDTRESAGCAAAHPLGGEGSGGIHPSFNLLVSRLFSLIVGASRPLIHYGCTFLLPLDLHQDADLLKEPAFRATGFTTALERNERAGKIQRHRLSVVLPVNLKDQAATEPQFESQAYLYFLPLLRNILFDVEGGAPSDANYTADATSPIKRWRLDPDFTRELRWQLLGTAGNAPGPAARIRDVSLYRYYNELYLLAIRVETAGIFKDIDGIQELESQGDSWWRPLFTSSPDTFRRLDGLRLENWLRFTKHARIVYPSFIEQIKEEKFDVQALVGINGLNIGFSAGDGVSPIIRYLLGQFLSENPDQPDQIKKLDELLRLQNLPEDRMFVNVAYGLAGPGPVNTNESDEADRLFSLALYVDRDCDTFDHAENYAYDSDYTRSILQQHRLDRWRMLGTYLGFCPYANAYMGFGEFFAKVIATEHVPYHYERMLILLLFYQLTLRNYNRRITHATKMLLTARDQEPSAGFRKLRHDFIEFTNRYWFREITLAIQGKEVFGKQIAALEIIPEYEEVKEEMERADEYVQSLRDRKLNERTELVGAIALFLTIVTVILPLMDIFEAYKLMIWCVISIFSVIVGILIYLRYKKKMALVHKSADVC